MTEADQALWDAIDMFVVARDEEWGYDVPQEKLKIAVREFVDQYFRDATYTTEQACEDIVSPELIEGTKDTLTRLTIRTT